MSTTTKLLATGLLCSAFSVASAAPILSVSGEGMAAATAAEQTFLASLQGQVITQDFEGFTAASDSSGQTLGPFVTNVATFQVNTTGTGGACNTNGFSCGDGLAVLDSNTSPFSGRFSVPGEDDNNWLDSMDAQKLTISVGSSTSALGFFMTDPNDSGGVFEIGGDIFDFTKLFAPNQPNGAIFYISIFDPTKQGLADISIITNNSNDGYGIDRVTAAVPEPSTLALLGLGLIGLGIARRRKHA